MAAHRGVGPGGRRRGEARRAGDPDNVEWLRRRHAELAARVGTSAGGAAAGVFGGFGGSFDALAHTVTVEGDWPRCAECGEYGSHEEHQPEELAAGGDAR